MPVRKLLAQRQTKENYTFNQWLGFIDHVFLTYGWRYRVTPQTGDEPWLDMFEDGMSAEDAVFEDLRAAL